jgi:hypothetical protein
MSFADIPQFLKNLAKADAARRQRKLAAINVNEVSGVDHPAHLHEGWLVAKAAAPAGHPAHATDRHYLSSQETTTAEALHGAHDLKPGESKPMGAGATLNREHCQCLSLTSPDTVAKAQGEAYAAGRRASSVEKASTAQYSPEEIAFLLGPDAK